MSCQLITYGQINSNCNNNGTNQTYTATAFFNYGAASGLYNSETTAAITVGQTVVNLNMYSASYRNELGFWGQFLLPPSAPFVQASEGNLGDRVEVTWTISKLSPVVTDVFKIYRNGTFLDEVAKDERVYVDYNVVAGEFYTYTVRGVNKAGVGMPGSSVGFLNPNGTITGQIKTISGNPVKDCAIDLTPTLGTSLRFTGDGMAFAEYSPLFDTSRFTLAFWVKQDSLNDSAGLIDLGSSIDKNWWVHTLPAASGRGIAVKLGGNTDSLTYIFPTETATAWHHIAVSYSGANLILYINGNIMGSMAATLTRDSIPLYFGSKTENTGYFKGNLDEILIYNKQLTQTEIQRNIYKSISGKTPGLIAYWKMDEGKGSKTYDLTQNENRMYMCGPAWSSKKAPVTNSSLSDENGYYIMEGINYGTGQTFTVKPSKKIYFDVSLEFNGSDEKWAELTNFDLPDSSSISISFNAFDLNGTQTILAKENHLNLKMVDSELILDLEGNEVILDTLTIGWNHVFLRLYQQMADLQLHYYRNGQLKKSVPVAITSSDWSMDGIHWTLGSSSPDTPADYFTGLIDEVVFYRDTFELSDIQLINNTGTNPGDARIFSYFSLNESQGDSLYNTAELGGVGVVHGATWANVSRIENTLDHEFLPSSKLVTLNKTNTSTDQVDFVDISTIPVSGYVRYDKTSCFVDSVEILVNGKSASPPIFTNANGYFVGDLEPGSSVKLSPKYHGHNFSPAFFEVKSIASPVAGILFLDKTTRTVSGQLAGGNCRKSIIPDMAIAKMKVFTINGCYEKEITLTTANGKFTFSDLPPLKCNIALSEHSVNFIFDYFQLEGGKPLDLTLKNDTIDFIYYAPPVITLTDFGSTICSETVLEQNKTYTTAISIHQEYFNGATCPVDTGTIIVYNGYNQDNLLIDTLAYGQSLNYSFIAGPPNIASPYTKTMQIDAICNGRTASLVKQAVILGKRPRNVNFTSTTPSIPIMILHDPPGDGSYAYIEEGEKNCTTLSFSLPSDTIIGGGVTYSYGPDLTIGTGIGVVKETTIDVVADLGVTWTNKTSSRIDSSGQVCFETLSRISTDAGEFLPGDTSDVFIGGAINMLFGVTDILRIDTINNNCFALDTGVHVVPGGFATNFYYSEYQIIKDIIPDLLIIGDTLSANRWQDIINQNNMNKAIADFTENISFGSGVSIEKSTINSSSAQNSVTVSTEVNEDIAAELGALVDGIGVVGNFNYNLNIGESTSNDTVNSSLTTFGYRLNDNDPGDIFTVNIKEDPVYGSPVFQTVAGVSSCPYEKKTVNRDEVTMTVDRFVANNIRENDAAVFNFNLGNISQTDEYRQYVFSLRSSSNVNGAIVQIAGADPLDTEYFIEPFQSVPVTVTVERGPTAFSDTLTFDFFVLCEDEKRIALGNPRTENKFHKSITIAVNFIEPCSMVDISSPQQDWVVTPSNGPNLSITLNDYDINDEDLDLIRVQYRRSQGNGLWINIVDIPKDSLGVLFENLDWDTDGLEDGLYEIRALAVCIGGIDVGISHVIKGRIERTPPDLFGTAEPADGVLSRGDEISITFNEPIQCTEIILAAGIGANIQNNNLGLYNTETGELIDFTLSCSEDKIILVPNIANKFIENKLLRVELDSILDLAGNKSGHFQWEFVVDRNGINWLDRQDVKVTKYEEDFVHVERRIENRSGSILDWELQNLPDWCSVYPTAGQLSPGDVRIINFDFDETMVFGKQRDTIQLHGPEGDEPMIIDARVICPTPDWSITAGDWEYAMNIVAALDIEGTLSQDEEDILAAFVDGELRGVSHIEYYPAIDKYLVFLTVYSNSTDPDTIDMRIWDASSCLLFSPVVESYIFESDDLIGSPLTPDTIHTSGLVLKEIPVHSGWNWLSFNLVLPESSPDSLLMDINNPTTGVIKSQTQFAQYSAGFGWFGSLDSIGNRSAYQLRILEQDTILMIGNLIDPDTVPIPLAIGWNWIGFIPRTPLPINTALANIDNLDGDVIKSQTQFSQYVSGFGWIGTLKNLRPTEGYIIKTSLLDTLTYPNLISNFGNKIIETEFRNPLPDTWVVNPSQYEHSMTLTGAIFKDNTNIVEGNWTLAAFVGNQCRGIAEAIWVEPMQAYVYFLTTYANISGELISYKFYNGDAVIDLNETNFFSIDEQIGNIMNPFPFTYTSSSVGDVNDDAVVLFIEPNPSSKGGETTLKYRSQTDEFIQIKILNQQGHVLYQNQEISKRGWNSYKLNTQNMVSGVYLVIVTNQNTSVRQKLILVD